MKEGAIMDRRRFFSTTMLGVFLVIIYISTESVYARENKNLKANLKVPDLTHVQILVTKDGSSLIGRIVEVKENEVQFETNIGSIVIPIVEIKKIKEVPKSSIKDGKYWYSDPNDTRLYFSPTGRNLKKGEGYFSDCYLFFPGISYGITNNITIGGGMSLFPGFEIDEQLFYFTPKVGLKATDNFNLATGALIIRIPTSSSDGNPTTTGVLYGVGTLGKIDSSITAGFGYGFVDGKFADKPMIMIGGEFRLSRRIAFVTENFIFPGLDEPLISYGFRFFGESLAVDIALINMLGGDSIFLGIPYIDFVFNF